jgi:hypothetical protein
VAAPSGPGNSRRAGSGSGERESGERRVGRMAFGETLTGEAAEARQDRVRVVVPQRGVDPRPTVGGRIPERIEDPAP